MKIKREKVIERTETQRAGRKSYLETVAMCQD
jgi:hypothetical protein